MTYGATPTGFVPATLDEIRNELLNAIAAIDDGTGQHPFLNASDDSVIQQMVTIFSDALAKAWTAAHLTSTQFDPAQAVGQYLTSLVQLNGLLRKPGIKTRITMQLNGTAGVTVPLGSAFTDLTRKHVFTTDAMVTLPASVTCTATEYSSWVPQPGEISLIQSPVPGLQSVTNTGIVQPGADRETDAALRYRQQVSTSYPSRSTVESLYAGVAQVAGVTYARIYQNLTMTTDARGIPAKEVCALVYGGADAEIAEVLFNRLPVGKVGHGNVTVPVLAEDGQIYDISFLRPTEVPIAVQIEIHPMGPDQMDLNYEDNISRNIVNYARYGGPGNSYGCPPGSTINRSRLYTPIMDSPGFSLISLKLGRVSSGTFIEDDLPIEWNEAPTFNEHNITVTVV